MFEVGGETGLELGELWGGEGGYVKGLLLGHFVVGCGMVWYVLLSEVKWAGEGVLEYGGLCLKPVEGGGLGL